MYMSVHLLSISYPSVILSHLFANHNFISKCPPCAAFDPVQIVITPVDDAVPYLGETIKYDCIAEGVTISSPPQWVAPNGEVLEASVQGNKSQHPP